MREDILIPYLKEQENPKLLAGDMSMMRHVSPEGGNDTVGYGHKLSNHEQFTGTAYGLPIEELTEEDAQRILKADVDRAHAAASRHLKSAYGVALEELPGREQAMLVDYQFNVRGGISSFPSFTKAVLIGDESTQHDEYIRHYTDAKGVRRPLARNRAFYSTFMSESAKASFGEYSV